FSPWGGARNSSLSSQSMAVNSKRASGSGMGAGQARRLVLRGRSRLLLAASLTRQVGQEMVTAAQPGQFHPRFLVVALLQLLPNPLSEISLSLQGRAALGTPGFLLRRNPFAGEVVQLGCQVFLQACGQVGGRLVAVLSDQLPRLVSQVVQASVDGPPAAI